MSKCSSQTKLPCKFSFSFLCLLGTSLICRGWIRVRELSADLSHTISSDNAVRFYGILCFGKQLAQYVPIWRVPWVFLLTPAYMKFSFVEKCGVWPAQPTMGVHILSFRSLHYISTWMRGSYFITSDSTQLFSLWEPNIKGVILIHKYLLLQDKIAFTVILKRISKIQHKTSGINYIVLKER